MFYVDNSVYWGSFKFSPEQATHLSYQYMGLITYADSRYVITTSGIYDNPSGTLLLNIEDSQMRAIITQSENLLLYDPYEKQVYVFLNE